VDQQTGSGHSSLPAYYKLHPIARYPGIYRRGDKKKGRYVVIVTLGHGRGQKKRTCRTLAEAIAVQAELRKAPTTGSSYRKGALDFESYATQWIAHYKGSRRGGIKEQTRLEWERMFAKGYFRQAFAGVRLSDVTVDHLNHYAELLAGKGLAAQTIKNRCTPVKRCLAAATSKGHITANPASGWVPEVVKCATVNQVRSLDEEELAAAREACFARYPLSLLIDFLWQTGLRIGEALALDRRHLDLKEGTCRVERRIYRHRPGQPEKDAMAPPKSERGIRTVRLSKEMCERLEVYCKGIDLNSPVWRNETRRRYGQRLTYSGVRNRFDRCLAKACVKRVADSGQEYEEPLDFVTLHMLRHTCASYLLRRKERGGLGLNAREAQHWLGHHSAAFTMDTYAHFFADELPDVEGFDAVTERMAESAARRARPALRVVKS